MEFPASHTLDDDGAIISTLVSMLAHFAIGRAVIPGLTWVGPTPLYVKKLRRLIETLGPGQSGKFFNYDGREYAW